MKTNIFTFTATLIVLGALLNGCATTSIDLVQTGVVSTSILPAEHGDVVQSVRVRKTNGDIKIYGKVKGPYPHRGIGGGHVDITILNPEGAVLKRATALLRHQHRPRVDNRPSSYTTRIPAVVEEGSKIEVKYHPGPVQAECKSR